MPELIHTMGALPDEYEITSVGMIRSNGFYRLARFECPGLASSYEVIDRAHPRSVSVLPIDEARRSVWLVEQPRYARAFGSHPPLRRALDEALRSGRMDRAVKVPAAAIEVLETVAGIIDPGETPEEAAIRELREEAGFEIGVESLVPVYSFFPSGGGLTEDVVCFHALLPEGAVWSPPKGDSDERMRVWKYAIDEAVALLDDRRVEGSATLALLQDLRHREQQKRIEELEARLAAR